MAVFSALKTVFSGAGRWVVIGLLVVAAIAIPGFGWYRARKKLKAETALREAAERRAEVEAKRAKTEAEAAETQRRINERLASERHRLAEKKTEVESERRDETARIAELPVSELASEFNALDGEQP